MKSKKTILSICLCLIMVLITVGGCGKSSALPSGLDLKTLGEELTRGVSFQDKDLAPLPDQLFSRYVEQVSAEDLLNKQVYAGGGAIAEEICLFEAKDAKTAEKVEKALQERFQYFRTSFGNYTPEQLKNLEKPALVRKDNYVFSVICSDNTKAEEIIQNWIKKQSK